MAPRALSPLLVVVGLTWLERQALASPLPETLAFEFSACRSSNLDQQALVQTVRSELEADGVGRVVDAPAAHSDGSLTVRVECDAALTIRARLKANGTGRERHEQIALGDAAPSARARALALALAELVRAGWPVLSAEQSSKGTNAASEGRRAALPAVGGTQPTASPNTAPPSSTVSAPAPAPAPSASSPEVPPSSTPSPTPLALTPSIERASAHTQAGPRNRALTWALGARLRWFIDYQSVLLGAEFGADFRALRLRAEVLASAPSDVLGSASLGSAALSVGYRVLDWRLGSMDLAAYPIASAGLTWLRGSSAQPSTRVEPATGFYADVRLMLQASLPRWTLAPTLSAEVGRASGFVARAGDRTLGATGGFFLGASVGARY